MMQKQPPTRYTVPIEPGKDGTRLDRTLSEALPDLSRTRLRALIEAGHVCPEGGAPVSDPAKKVRAGQIYEITVPDATPAAPEPQAMELDIVYEDSNVIVINKPAGMVVHPAAGNPDRTLVNALLAHAAISDKGGLSGIGGVERPGIVHRLDKGTSGLMVVAKNDAAHACLSRQFAERSIERVYQAVVWGVPSPRQGEIEGNIGRSTANRKKMAVVKRGGKPALTRFKVIKPLGLAASLVECRLATGRTHQIRVHMAHLGHPVIGDPLYGRVGRPRMQAVGEKAAAAIRELNHQVLHAYIIGFIPVEGAELLHFENKLPYEINSLIGILENE